MNSSYVQSMTDAEIVDVVSSSLIGEIGAPGKLPETPELQLFSDVYSLDLEIGSGASFEQYFRWSDKNQVERILDQLAQIGLPQIRETTRQAIQVAFPDGVPEKACEYQNYTNWSEEQENLLKELYENEPEIHSIIERKLAEFVREKGILSMSRFKRANKLNNFRLWLARALRARLF